eukprot:scaffold43088_cov64-Phaeocystis_antarctica.AAC.8
MVGAAGHRRELAQAVPPRRRAQQQCAAARAQQRAHRTREHRNAARGVDQVPCAATSSAGSELQLSAATSTWVGGQQVGTRQTSSGGMVEAQGHVGAALVAVSTQALDLRSQWCRLGGVVAQVGQQPRLAVRQPDASGLARRDQPHHPHAAAQLEHLLVQEVRLAPGAEPAREGDAAVPEPAARAEAQLAKLADLHRLARREAHGPLLEVCRGAGLLPLGGACADMDALAALHDIARWRQLRERLDLASARRWCRLLGGESRGLAGARRLGVGPALPHAATQTWRGKSEISPPCPCT